jgi:beta-lactam-binding protein with PASTA domain
MTIKDFFTASTNRFFWLNILAMFFVAILLLFCIFKGLDVYTHHGEEVTVPNIKGMMPNEANNLLREQGLVAKIVNTSYQSNMPSGSILEISPEAGEKVKKGRIIFLTINSINAPLREVPDIIENSSARQAEAQLLAAGFHLTANQAVNGYMDWVYGIVYNGRHIMTGEKIPIGSTLTLQVGDGKVATPESEDSLSLEETVPEEDASAAAATPAKPEQKTESKGEVKKETPKSNVKKENTQKESTKKNNKSTNQPNSQQPEPKKKAAPKKAHKNENSNNSWFS